MAKICNMCGKEFDTYDHYANFSLWKTIGYGSRHDNEDIQLDFCCNCMDKIIDECKISPIIPKSKSE